MQSWVPQSLTGSAPHPVGTWPCESKGKVNQGTPASLFLCIHLQTLPSHRTTHRRQGKEKEGRKLLRCTPVLTLLLAETCICAVKEIVEAGEPGDNCEPCLLVLFFVARADFFSYHVSLYFLIMCRYHCLR